jgi:hypothetical protein
MLGTLLVEASQLRGGRVRAYDISNKVWPAVNRWTYQMLLSLL